MNVCSPDELNTHVGFPDIGSIGHPPSAAADGPTNTIESVPASSNTSQHRHEWATRVIRQTRTIASSNDAACSPAMTTAKRGQTSNPVSVIRGIAVNPMSAQLARAPLRNR